MKLTPKFLDPTDITTLVNKSTGKHIIADGLSVIPIYKGKQYSIKDVVNKDGTVNVKKAKKIMEEVAEYFGGKKMQNRPENPVWHKDDPNTWLHTKKVAKNAWNMPVPEGYTKQDQMVAALGHDFGKILSGDGHAEVSYNLIKQIFPDATEQQLNAIRKHMDPIETIVDKLELATKKADMGILPTPEGHTRLYRVQRQGAEFDPHAAANGEAQREYAGMWFTDDSSKGAWYAHNGSRDRIPKGMKYSEWKKLHENDPAPVMELQYVDVPTDQLESYRASKILEGKNFDYEPEDFLIPNEIQRTMVELPWDRKKPYVESVRDYEAFIKMLNSFKDGGNIQYFDKGGSVYKLLNELYHKVNKGIPFTEWSPEQWDQVYNYVLKRYGEKESNVLQKIRDYHFYAAAPDTVVKGTSGKPIQVFHGGTSPSIREFSLNTPNNASLTETLDKRIYFSDRKGVAAQYAVDPEYKLALTIDHLADAVGLDKEGIEIIASSLKMPVKDVKKIIEDYEIGFNFVMRKTNEEDFIYPAYLNIRKHADIDLDGEVISKLSEKQRAKINAEPAAIIRNVDETVSNQYGMRTRPTTDYLVQYPQQIKRSAAITYDTNGNIIPISQRDDFHNPDINFKKGGKLNKFQEGGVLEEPIEMPMFKHLPNEQVAQDFDNDLTELLYSRQIKYGQLSEKAERKLQKKYNLDYTQLKETLDDLFTAGLGNALLADLLIANNSLKTYAQGGMIQKCSIGSAIKKFAGEGLENLGEKLAKEVGEDMALQATGTTKVIGKATTEHLRKVAKSTGDQRVKVLADFAEKCREKGIKLPEEFNQFVDAIFKVPTATKTDTKISRVGKEITADPEIIEWKGIVTERPTFEKTKYKTKTVHTGEFQNKLEFKRAVPKTQKELQEVSPKIDEAIDSLRSMMEGDAFKLTPTMLDEIYAKTKSKVQNFSGNKEQTGLLRRFFGEIEYPTLVERQPEKTYVHPTTSNPNLERFYDASADNINWFKKVKIAAQNYVQVNPNYDVEKIKVLPLKIIPKDKELAVYHRIGNYTSFLPKQIMTKRDAPYIKAYRFMAGNKPVKGVPTFNFEEHHSTPLSLMQAEAYLENPSPKNAMEHALTYQKQRKVNGSKEDHYNKFLVLDKAEHTGVNGIHYNDKWSPQDLQRIKALARTGRFKTMEDLLYYYDRLKAWQLSFLQKAKQGTKLIPKNAFGSALMRELVPKASKITGKTEKQLIKELAQGTLSEKKLMELTKDVVESVNGKILKPEQIKPGMLDFEHYWYFGHGTDVDHLPAIMETGLKGSLSDTAINQFLIGNQEVFDAALEMAKQGKGLHHNAKGFSVIQVPKLPGQTKPPKDLFDYLSPEELNIHIAEDRTPARFNYFAVDTTI